MSNKELNKFISYIDKQNKCIVLSGNKNFVEKLKNYNTSNYIDIQYNNLLENNNTVYVLNINPDSLDRYIFKQNDNFFDLCDDSSNEKENNNVKIKRKD